MPVCRVVSSQVPLDDEQSFSPLCLIALLYLYMIIILRRFCLLS